MGPVGVAQTLSPKIPYRGAQGRPTQRPGPPHGAVDGATGGAVAVPRPPPPRDPVGRPRGIVIPPPPTATISNL